MELPRVLTWALPVLLFLSVFVNNGVLVEASHKVYLHLQNEGAVNVQTVHRTGYHFQPPMHWINDPNGPMYFNGYYHLFYQYNPKGAVWGNIIWAHSVSKDLINWIPLKPAIVPSKPFDQYGAWSGSATILPGNKPVILYTGIIDPNNTQVQNYAIPANYSDPYLEEWIKPDDNPLIVAQIGVNKSAFRDPSTAWMAQDGHWRIILGSRRKHRGIAYLYRSKDFKKWIKAKHPLHSVAGDGNFECPDFYPVQVTGENGLDTSANGPNVKYVFKASFDDRRFEYYSIGTWSHVNDRYVPDPGMVETWKGLRYDYGNYYASKSFFDYGKNRRIVWGWSNESDTPADDMAKGWAGIQVIPRKVWLDPNGKQLLQWPVEELDTLRTNKTHLRNQQLAKGVWNKVSGITAAQADVEVVFSFPSLDKAEKYDPSWNNLYAEDVCAIKGGLSEGGLGPFGLATLASMAYGEFTPVSFTIFKDDEGYKVLFCSDARRASTRKIKYIPSFGGWVDVDLSEKKISLRTLIDHSVVEAFAAGGKTVITSRVYPEHAIYDKAELYAFNNGTEIINVETLEAWSMKRPQMN
uniref:Cell-wall invertase 1 n=1 Tax=Eustoma russellianum TaxID=52518 RepID=A0A7R7EF91_EUSRU|nr:cell-wall invertase 1 [Eustoma grandiflorum]